MGEVTGSDASLNTGKGFHCLLLAYPSLQGCFKGRLRKLRVCLSIRPPTLGLSSSLLPTEGGVWTDGLLLGDTRLAVRLASRSGAGTRLHQVS
jgi:hypothetical protein